MLNKPINASPNNICVDKSEDVQIKYEIPNAKIDGCRTWISRLTPSGAMIIQDNNYEDSTNCVDLNIPLSPIVLVNSKEFVCNSSLVGDPFYYGSLVNFDISGIVVDDGDEIEIEINDGEAIASCVISLFLNSQSQLTSDNVVVGDFSVGYLSGMLIISSKTSGASGTVKAILKTLNTKEYTWESVYWKTPSASNKKYTVCGLQGNKLFVRPPLGNGSSESITTYTPTYQDENVSGCWVERARTYTSALYEDYGHSEDSDTSQYCYKGQLTDYFGYVGFEVNSSGNPTIFSIINNIEVGKCIFEIYDRDGILAFHGRVIAYDKYGNNTVFLLFDKNHFYTNGLNRMSVYSPNDGSGDRYVSGKFMFYSIDVIEKNNDMNGLVNFSDKYYISKNAALNTHQYSLSLVPLPDFISDVCGQTISVWSSDVAEFNTTPTYYFRAKTPPVCSVTSSSTIIDGDRNVLKDIRGSFGVIHDSENCALNYFYLELYRLTPTLKWEFIEKSPLIYDSNEAYEFKCLSDGDKYKIKGVCVDVDTDEWNAEELEFVVDAGFKSYNIPIHFNPKSTTTDISLGAILKSYNTAQIEIYKTTDVQGAEQRLLYVGGGLAKSDGVIYFDELRDYNIKNAFFYKYYIRVEYTGKESADDMGIDFFLASTNVEIKFDGTSILGLDKSPLGDLTISKRFDILYHLENREMSELKNEIKRDYIDSFSKYPKELRGHHNYKSGSCAGLLGYEYEGEYVEPRTLRDRWTEFINDNTIKLYRGFDGETMIISIESSSIKPHYYINTGLVNEINISFKEIASVDQYAIFTTEKTGE